jgi:hypothetical protein
MNFVAGQTGQLDHGCQPELQTKIIGASLRAMLFTGDHQRIGGRRLRRVLAGSAVSVAAAAFLVAAPADAVVTGGAVHSVPGVSGGFASIACSSSSSCVAVGGTDGGQGFLVTVTNGVPGPVQVFSNVLSFESVACPSSTLCVANGQAGDGSLVLVSLVQGGVRQVLTDTSAFNPGVIACASASSCVVALQPQVVDVTVAADGSMTTAFADPLPTGVIVIDMACYSSTSCIGVGENFLGSSNQAVMIPFTNGSTGAAIPLSGLDDLSAIGCSASGSCLAGGETSDFSSGVLVPVTLGGPGPVQTVGTLVPTGISCLPSTECVAVGFGVPGQAAQATASGSAESQLQLAYTPSGVACPTATTCYAAGREGDYPSDVPVIGTITVSEPAPAFNANPTSVTFAPQRIGTTSPAATVTVTNTGGAPLTFSSVGLGGTNPSAFHIVSNTCTGSVAAGGHCTTNVTFKPGADKAFSAVLRYTDNAPGSPQSIPLSGRGCFILSGTNCT